MSKRRGASVDGTVNVRSNALSRLVDRTERSQMYEKPSNSIPDFQKRFLLVIAVKGHVGSAAAVVSFYF
jgi:hypothetical protein